MDDEEFDEEITEDRKAILMAMRRITTKETTVATRNDGLKSTRVARLTPHLKSANS